MKQLLRHLRRAALLCADGVGDGQLLEHYLAGRDADAFEALVRRHGPMVLGVCRRVVGNPHDAEDAFQATFLVLVRKAGSIRPRERVGPWLYGVAYRTALKLRTMTHRRRAHECRAAAAASRLEPERRDWQELVPLLDRELSRLPEKYRTPIILCDLEGHGRKEAAARLGWPEGTLSGRLARGRALLAKRLARHGPALSAGLLAALLQQQASAAVPFRLLGVTLKTAAAAAVGPAAGATTAAALAEGVIKIMLLERLKMTAAILGVAGALTLGVSAGVLRTAAATSDDPDTKFSKPARPAEKSLVDLLPNDPLPTPVVAALDDGDLVIKFRTVVYRAQPGMAGGWHMQPVPRVQERRHAAEDVRVYDIRGKTVDPRDLPRLLRKETVAVAYLYGQPMDPLHLRLLKDGMLVFCLPAPQVAAPPMAPPAAPFAPQAVPAPPLPAVPPRIAPPVAVPPAAPGALPRNRAIRPAPAGPLPPPETTAPASATPLPPPLNEAAPPASPAPAVRPPGGSSSS